MTCQEDEAMFRQSQFVFFGIALLSVAALVADRTTTAGHSAPAAERRAPATRTALIDIAKVFQNCESFKSARVQLKQEITAREKQAKELDTEIQSLKNQLRDLEPDSDLYAEVEAELKQHNPDFKEFRKNTHVEFLNVESNVYRETYQRIETAVEQFAETHKIDLVLRFNSNQLEETDPQTLMQGRHPQVVYHRDLEITDQILAILNDQ